MFDDVPRNLQRQRKGESTCPQSKIRIVNREPETSQLATGLAPEADAGASTGIGAALSGRGAGTSC